MAQEKINQLDKRWATGIEDRTRKVDRQLLELEKMMANYARIGRVSINIRHVQMARKELAAVANFARLTKNIIKNAEGTNNDQRRNQSGD